MGWIQHYLLKILNFTRENWVSVHRNGGYIIVGDSCYLAITVNEEIYEMRERKKQRKKYRNEETKRILIRTLKSENEYDDDIWFANGFNWKRKINKKIREEMILLKNNR